MSLLVCDRHSATMPTKKNGYKFKTVKRYDKSTNWPLLESRGGRIAWWRHSWTVMTHGSQFRIFDVVVVNAFNKTCCFERFLSKNSKYQDKRYPVQNNMLQNSDEWFILSCSYPNLWQTIGNIGSVSFHRSRSWLEFGPNASCPSLVSADFWKI
jgi:hypothetical protein